MVLEIESSLNCEKVEIKKTKMEFILIISPTHPSLTSYLLFQRYSNSTTSSDTQ